MLPSIECIIYSAITYQAVNSVSWQFIQVPFCMLHVSKYRKQLTFEQLNHNKGEVNYAIYIISSCLVE